MYRFSDGRLEVFLAHPGGPFCRHRDRDCWSIPKGEVEASESLLEAAIREFEEEVGVAPKGPFLELGWIRQKSGKTVYAWAFAGEWPATQILRSNTFELEWPPASGRTIQFPEVDRVGFFSLDDCRPRLKAAQHAFLDRLAAKLAEIPTSPAEERLKERGVA